MVRVYVNGRGSSRILRMRMHAGAMVHGSLSVGGRQGHYIKLPVCHYTSA
jgi:hypothetical protein